MRHQGDQKMMELSNLLKKADKKVFEELAELTGLAKTTFVPGEPYQSAYNEGIRSIGLRLLALSEQNVVDTTKEVYKQRNLKWKK